MTELREQVVRGVAYLVGRESLALLVSLVGVAVLVRQIGPTSYGLYAGASGIVFVVGSVGTFGLDVYLIRRLRVVTKTDLDQAVTLLVLAAAVATAATVALVPLVLRALDEPRFVTPLRVLAASLPLTLLEAPLMASLERELNYRMVALIEMVQQFVYYGAALTLAFLGAGVWSPVTGLIASQAWLLVATYSAQRYRPALTWDGGLVREMVRYGTTYSVSAWLWQLRGLVNPLVVGHFLGAAAVGFVGLTARLVEATSFVRNVAWRLSIAAFGRLQRDLPRFKRAVEEAMALQTLSVAPLLAIIGSVGPWLLPAVFGHRWEPVVHLFPYIAIGMIFQAVFNMETSALFVVDRGRSVVPVHALHVALFVGGATLCVWQFGVVGFGYAELIALAAYLLLDHKVRSLFAVSYRDALPWVAAFIPPLFALHVSAAWVPALWVPLLAVAASRRRRAQIRGYASYLRRQATAAHA